MNTFTFVQALLPYSNFIRKMRSDALIKEDPRAQVLIAPPGTNPAEYLPAPANKGTRRDGPGRGRNRRGGKRGGGIAARMDLD